MPELLLKELRIEHECILYNFYFLRNEHFSMNNVTIQHDQINMAVLLWHLVKCDLSSEHHRTVAYTSVTFHKIPRQNGHVFLVNLMYVAGNP